MDNIMITTFNEVKTYAEMPSTVKYFQEITIVDKITLPNEYEDIDRVASSYVRPKVLNSKIIETATCLSYEGQNLSGNKLIVELGIEQNIKYISCKEENAMHAYNKPEAKKSIYIVVPTEYKGVEISSLIRQKKFIVTPYISDIYYKLLNNREIFSCVSLLVDFKFLN